MKKESSCISVFPTLKNAQDAIQYLIAADVNEACISLVAEIIQQGMVAADGLEFIEKDLHHLGVQKANLYGYLSLVYSDTYLLIVSGNHTEVEFIYSLLQQDKQSDTAIHFNTE